MTTETMNPLTHNGTPRVPLVLSYLDREKYARGYRDSCAELVCTDLLAGRDHTWQLNTWKAYDDFIGESSRLYSENHSNGTTTPEFGW